LGGVATSDALSSDGSKAVDPRVLAQANMLALNPALWIAGAVAVGSLAEHRLRRSKHALHSLEIAEAEADSLRYSGERLAYANEALTIERTSTSTPQFHEK